MLRCTGAFSDLMNQREPLPRRSSFMIFWTTIERPSKRLYSDSCIFNDFTEAVDWPDSICQTDGWQQQWNWRKNNISFLNLWVFLLDHIISLIKVQKSIGWTKDQAKMYRTATALQIARYKRKCIFNLSNFLVPD